MHAKTSKVHISMGTVEANGCTINTLNPRVYINGNRYYENVNAVFDVDGTVVIHHN